MKADLASILDECLARMRGGESVQRCLDAFPEHAQELEPLLRQADVLRSLPAVAPSAEAMVRGRQALLRKLASMPQRKKGSRLASMFDVLPFWAMVGWPSAPGRARAWASALLVAGLSAAAAIVLGTGTIVLAQDSLPGTPLYPVKMVSETTQVALTPDGQAKADLYMLLAQRRLTEALAQANREHKVSAGTLLAMRDYTSKILDTISRLPEGESRDTLARFLQLVAQQEVGLREVRAFTGPEGQEAASQALSAVHFGGQAARQALENPKVLAGFVPAPVENVVMVSEFLGIVESTGSKAWVVSGKTILVDANTAMAGGQPTVGGTVEVEIAHLRDGTLLALEIEVETPEEHAAEVEFQGKVSAVEKGAWVIGGKKIIVDGETIVIGSAKVGLAAQVEALRRADGTIHARKIRTFKVQDEARLQELSGQIEALSAGAWKVSGRLLVIDANTFIDESEATAQVGRKVEATLWLRNGDSPLALRIKVKKGEALPPASQSPIPGISPTPRPSRTPTATRSPEPTGTKEPEKQETPEAAKTEAPEATKTPTPTPSGTISPEPTKTPEDD
ncbi:MAG: DUF5666 domain-containing protein [Chloroflexota bacterium]